MNNLILMGENESRTYCNNKLKLKLNSDELDEIIHIGQSNNLLDILASAYIEKGNLLYAKRLFNEAFTFYSSTLNLYNNINVKDDDFICIYNKLAKCKLMTLCYEEALSYLCVCYSYTLENKDKNNYINCTFNIALTYKKLKDFDNCIFYTDKLLNFIDTSENFTRYIECIILKANCYIEKNCISKAILIYEELLQNFQGKLGNHLGFIYNNLGLAYLDENNLECSLSFFEKAINFRSINDKPRLSRTLIDMSNVFIKKGSYKDAILSLNHGLKLAKEYSNKEYLLLGYELLEKVYKELNDTTELKNLYIEMLDTLKNIDPEVTMDVYVKLSRLLPNNTPGYNKLDTIFSESKL
ncbi:MAG: tetratricopeptide repeat protein [Clostridium sp.]